MLKPNANLTENDLREWRKQRIAANKYPLLVEFYDSFPMNATGKILKRELREKSN